MRACSDLLVSKVLTAAQSRVRRVRGGGLLARSGSAPSARAAQPRPRPAVGERPGKPVEPPSAPPSAVPGPSSAPACLVIGISTGGPQALSQVLPTLSPPTPPILVVQHMPAHF